MARDPRAYLWDARQAVRLIRRFTDGRTLADYIADDMLHSAAERQLEIVGEALSALRHHAPDLARTVPHLDRIVAFRNVLIHDYIRVDHRLVWAVIETELGSLEQVLDDLLDDEPAR